LLAGFVAKALDFQVESKFVKSNGVEQVDARQALLLVPHVIHRGLLRLGLALRRCLWIEQVADDTRVKKFHRALGEVRARRFQVTEAEKRERKVEEWQATKQRQVSTLENDHAVIFKLIAARSKRPVHVVLRDRG